MNAEGERPADVLINNGVIEAVQANLTVRMPEELHCGAACRLLMRQL